MANNPVLTELGIDGQVLDLINAERAKVGVKALNDNGQIDDAADRQALDMAKNMNLSETGSDGSTIASRTKDAGYASTNVDEAIAAGPMDAQEVVAQWLNDPTQKNKLLNPKFEDAALGTVADTNGKLYWAETFGGPEIAPAPAPTPANPMTPPVAANPDPMGATTVGNPKDFYPSKNSMSGGSDKYQTGTKMSFAPTNYKSEDLKNNPLMGDVKNSQQSNDPMGAPQNPMGTSDMMSAPTYHMGMH
jgi:hypothetical protein